MALPGSPARHPRPTIAAVAVAMVVLPLALSPPSAAAPVSTCKGKYLRENGDLEIQYRFRCDGPFTRYSVRSSRELDLFSGNGLVFPSGGGEQVASFECQGDIPGREVVCEGDDENVADGRQLLTGEVSLAARTCRALRLVVRVTNAEGETSERFRLRAPRRCEARRKR
jgi:hypothetical protein